MDGPWVSRRKPMGGQSTLSLRQELTPWSPVSQSMIDWLTHWDKGVNSWLIIDLMITPKTPWCDISVWSGRQQSFLVRWNYKLASRLEWDLLLWCLVLNIYGAIFNFFPLFFWWVDFSADSAVIDNFGWSNWVGWQFVTVRQGPGTSCCESVAMTMIMTLIPWLLTKDKHQ